MAVAVQEQEQEHVKKVQRVEEVQVDGTKSAWDQVLDRITVVARAQDQKAGGDYSSDQ